LFVIIGQGSLKSLCSSFQRRLESSFFDELKENWIPAFAGMTAHQSFAWHQQRSRVSGEIRGPPDRPRPRIPLSLHPGYVAARDQSQNWIPAFAGMTSRSSFLITFRDHALAIMA